MGGQLHSGESPRTPPEAKLLSSRLYGSLPLLTLVMERWDLRLHLVWQKRRVVGPRMGMKSWRKRQARVTVPAVQQFLGTHGRGSPGGELPPQGKVVCVGPVPIAELGSSAQVGL